jgi:mRNA-degrading endonuclease YafQ of YafQ-DinJ toxin-antitoxin module
MYVCFVHYLLTSSKIQFKKDIKKYLEEINKFTDQFKFINDKLLQDEETIKKYESKLAGNSDEIAQLHIDKADLNLLITRLRSEIDFLTESNVQSKAYYERNSADTKQTTTDDDHILCEFCDGAGGCSRRRED